MGVGGGSGKGGGGEGGRCLSLSGKGGGGVGCGGRLLTFSAFRMGAYSRWALIRGWALIRINTVYSGPRYGSVHFLFSTGKRGKV